MKMSFPAAFAALLLASAGHAAPFPDVVTDPVINNWTGAAFGTGVSGATGSYGYNGQIDRISLSGVGGTFFFTYDFPLTRFGWTAGIGVDIGMNNSGGSRRESFVVDDGFGNLSIADSRRGMHVGLDGAVTARLGYPMGNFRPYAELGIGGAQLFESTAVDYHGVYQNYWSKDHLYALGFVWGAGLGWAPFGTDSMRIEARYRHMNLGSMGYGGPGYHDNRSLESDEGLVAVSMPAEHLFNF
jgi:opacity protein-like surface antigen